MLHYSARKRNCNPSGRFIDYRRSDLIEHSLHRSVGADQVLNISIPPLVLMKEAQKDFTPRFAEQGEGSGKMRKTLLVFLTVLFMAPMLSGCFYPYRDDWNGRGYRHDRGYQEDRGYNGQRDGYRDYRERR